MSANDYDLDDFDFDPRGGEEQVAEMKIAQLRAENDQLRADIARDRGLTPEQDAHLAGRLANAKSADEVKTLLLDHGISPYGNTL